MRLVLLALIPLLAASWPTPPSSPSPLVVTYEADVAGRLTRPVVEYTGGDGSSRRVRLDGRSFSLSVAMPSGARGTYRLALRGRAAEAQLRVQVTVRQDGQVLAVRRGAGVFTSGMAEVSAAVEVPIEGE